MKLFPKDEPTDSVDWLDGFLEQLLHLAGLQGDALLLRFTLCAEPFLAPFLDCRQNVGFVAGMFKSHVLEQDFELHRPHRLQGLSDFANEGFVLHPASIHVFPTTLCQTAARFNGRAKVRGDQRFQGNG